MYTAESSTAVDGMGEVATDESELRIIKLYMYSSEEEQRTTTVGVMSMKPFAEKARTSTLDFEMVCTYIMFLP